MFAKFKLQSESNKGSSKMAGYPALSEETKLPMDWDKIDASPGLTFNISKC
jgi:hypothetical protein